MGFIYLLTHIVFESAGKTIDKINFKRTRISPQLMMTLIFGTMSLAIGLYILIASKPFPELTVPALIVAALIAVISAAGNVFDVISLKVDDLSLREPLVDFEPILAGLIGYALFPDERKPVYLAAFIIGAFIVRWGIHRRKLRKYQAKGMHYLFIATVLYATLPSLYHQAFTYMSPEYVAFFRVAVVFVLVAIFFPQKKLKKALKPGRVWYTVLSGCAYAIGTVASLYAIQAFGVALSMLFFMLGPALRYLAGQFILNEKVRRGEVLSSLMLTLVVAIAAFAS
jgi:glucose uptake protein GlcU